MTEESGLYIEDHEIILEHFNRIYQQYGEDDVRSLSWGSDNSQQERFRVLAEIADLEGCSILDVGCGFGDLYRFLTKKVKDFRYAGYDLNANVVKAARRKIPGVRFVCCDILESSEVEAYDYVLSSGIHNLKLADNERTWKALVRRMVRTLSQGSGHEFPKLLYRWHDG